MRMGKQIGLVSNAQEDYNDALERYNFLKE
jgi:hypothetical protein